jgi:hypothetical protein
MDPAAKRYRCACGDPACPSGRPMTHEPGKVRITSDGTIEGTTMDVLAEDGTWTQIKGVARACLDAGEGTVVAFLEVHAPLLDIAGAVAQMVPSAQPEGAPAPEAA